MSGYFTFILHTHLPYVLHHGKWPHGSDWLTEAAAECYIPILETLDKLYKRDLHVRISMDFSPVNLEQLSDPAFQFAFIDYCNEKILAAEEDYEYFAQNNEAHFQPLALFWKDYFTRTKDLFVDKYGGDLVAGFRLMAERGVLDPMTCGATHGYFPLLLRDENIRAQLKAAIHTHTKHFGKPPRGVWLPECAYRPGYKWRPPAGGEEYRSLEYDRKGIEELLSEVGLEYFVVDGALTKGGDTIGAYPQFTDVLRKLYAQSDDPYTKRKIQKEREDRSLSEIYGINSSGEPLPGVTPVVFSRDPRTSEKVWSGSVGYPGDPTYLDFHKKHHNSGLRYWRVSGAKVDLKDKEQYDPQAVESRLYAQAHDFVHILKTILDEHKAKHGTPGIVASPFDTELFGHWWHEGPMFIEKVIEHLDGNDTIKLTNCAEVLDLRKEPRVVITLPEGSWGEGGHHFVWLNKDVRWMWDIIYPLEDRFLSTLRHLNETAMDELQEQIMKQAARELLLLESSDWPFLITTGGATDYASMRLKQHAERLRKLLDITDRYQGGHGLTEDDSEILSAASLEDGIFPDIDLAWWM